VFYASYVCILLIGAAWGETGGKAPLLRTQRNTARKALAKEFFYRGSVREPGDIFAIEGSANKFIVPQTLLRLVFFSCARLKAFTRLLNCLNTVRDSVRISHVGAGKDRNLLHTYHLVCCFVVS
jgi:hypothetical protein